MILSLYISILLLCMFDQYRPFCWVQQLELDKENFQIPRYLIWT